MERRVIEMQKFLSLFLNPELPLSFANGAFRGAKEIVKKHLINFKTFRIPRIIAAAKVSILLLMPVTANSHSPLISSNPQDSEIFHEAPTEIVMVFKSAAKLIKVNLTKLSVEQSKSLLGGLFGTDSGEQVFLDTTFLMKIKVRHVIPLPQLRKGDYSLVWRAMGEDGHVIKGELNFKILDG